MLSTLNGELRVVYQTATLPFEPQPLLLKLVPCLFILGVISDRCFCRFVNHKGRNEQIRQAGRHAD